MSLKKASIGENLLEIAGRIVDVKDNAKDVSNIIKGIDDVGDLGKVFNLAGVSKKTVKATLDLADMGDAVLDVTNAMDSFAGSQKGIKGIGEAFKGLGSNVLGFVKSNWATIAVLSTIGIAIGAAYYQITKFSRSIEQAKKSQSEYASTISEIQSLNSEIDTTSSKISELEARGPLTITQKSELDQLKLQNAELERQRDIKQQLANSQATQAVDDAMETLDMNETFDITQKSQRQKLLESDNIWDRLAAGAGAGVYNMPYEQADIITATQNEVKALNDLKKTKEELLLERDSATKSRKKEIDTEISGLEKEIDLYDTEVSKNIEILDSLRSNFIDKSDLSSKEQQKFDAITNVIDEYTNLNPLAKQAKALSEIWENDDFAKAQQKLVDVFRTGNDLSIDEISNQFPGLVSACNDAGISVSTLREELIALASQDSGVTRLEEDFMSFQTQLVSSIGIIDSVNAALANSFSGKGLNVEIDEETDAIIGDIANIKASFSGLEGYDASVLFEKTANGISLNTVALRELQAQQEATQKSINLKKIKDLQEQLQEAMDVMKDAKTDEDFASSQLIVNDLKNQLEIAQELSAAYDGATSAYQKWINAQSNGESGDMFRTVSETMRERGADLYKEGRYNTNEFRAIADYYSSLDLSTASIEELVNAYESAKPVIDNFFTGDKQGIDNFIAKIQQLSNESNLGWVEELENGSVKFNVSTKELADALGISQEAVETMFDAGKEYRDIIFANDLTDDFTKSLDEMANKANEAKSRLEELNKTDQLNLDLNFDFDSEDINDLESQIQRATSNLEQFKNQDGIVDLSVNGAEDAITIFKTLIQQKHEVESIIMTINTSALDESAANVVGKLQEYQTAINNLSTLKSMQSVGIQIDTSQIDNAKAKIDTVFSELQGMSENGNLQINADVSVDTSSADALSADLANMTPEIAMKIVPDSTEADDYESEDKDADVIYNVDDSKVNAWKPPVKRGNVIYEIKTSGILPTNLTRTVTYNTVTSNPGNAGSLIGDIADNVKKGLKGKAYGTVPPSAYARGTAYNVINTIPAYANGQVALQKDERAVVNELGSEGLIRDGVLSWIPGGMHIQNFKKGDIILSADQMESLFSIGKATGTGKAYANGTASVRDLASTGLHAYANPNANGTWVFGNVGNGNIGGSGYSPNGNNTSSNNDNSDTNSNLDQANDSAEEFKETLDGIEILINRIERDIKNIERVAGSAYNTFAKRNRALRNQISSIYEEISIQQQGYNRYLQEAESVPLSEEYKNLVRNGAIDISTITDKDLSENINKYKEWYEKALDCRDAIEELTESVRDLYKQAFDNVVTMYDGMLSQIEHRHNMLEGYIDQTEAQGYIVSTKYYDAMITNEQNKLSKLNKERNNLINALNDAIVNGDIEVESEAWYDMQASINSVNESIQESTTNIIEFKNAIREIEWSVFDKIQDRISSITTEADFLKDLMSDEKMYDDNGKVTKHGTATYGLHGVNYNVYMSQADQYRKEMESIQKELSKDPYNETLIERRKELLELQQESILAAEEEKDAIKNLVQEGIEKQLEALEKLIDKYLEAIDSQKDMHDYQKKIEKEQKEIDSLRKQLVAYAGDDSEEGSVKKQQTENKLKEAEENLEESLYDKAISDQKKLLDELYSEYETILNMRLDNIDVLINEVIANINSDASEIRDTLVSEAEKVGYKLTDSMNTIWGTNGTIANILNTYSNNFSSTMTTVQSAINSIKIAIQNAIAASNKSASSNISSIDQQQTQQTTVSKPTTPKPDYSSILNSKPSAPSNGGGDGVPRIGDKVTYVSGSYFYSSDGLNPSGNQMLGQQVYITNINNASWAQKPYHISRTSRLGEQDLGWVNLNQLSGYKTGKFMIDRDQLGITQEEGNEIILGRSDGAMLMPNGKGQLTTLKRGDAVVDADGTNNLLSFANNPDGYLQRMINKVKSEDYSMKGEVVGGQTQNEININVELENVRDYNDFLIQMQHDPKFERMIQAMSIDRLAGKSSLGKYGVIFRR